MTKVISRSFRDAYGVPWFNWYRQWETQRPPFRTPLRFTFWKERRTSWFTSIPDPWGTPPPVYTYLPYDYFDEASYNQAYARLVGKIGDPSQWAVNFAESRQGIDMIVRRAGDLGRAANYIRRGLFSQAAKSFGIKVPRGLRHLKQFGDLWLEFHFGWVPLIKDVGAAIDTIQKADFSVRKITGSGRTDSYGVFRTNQGSGMYRQETWRTSITTKARCDIRIENPNLYLANQMGFVNPASVAWELIPYSWFVDWSSNVGAVLSSFSDFAGLSVTNAYVTMFGRQNVSRVVDHTTHPYPPERYYATDVNEAVLCRRILGLPLPTLQVKGFKGFSPERGATAWAVFMQNLPKH